MTNPQLPTPTSKEELASLIRTGRGKMHELIRGLTSDQVLQVPGPQATKNVRDLLAHVVWWEEFMMFRVLLVKAGEPIQQVENLVAINTQVYETYRNQPFEESWQHFNAFLPILLGFIHEMSWKDIDGDIPYLGGTVLNVIASNTYEHYQEHLPGLQAFVNSL